MPVTIESLVSINVRLGKEICSGGPGCLLAGPKRLERPPKVLQKRLLGLQMPKLSHISSNSIPTVLFVLRAATSVPSFQCTRS